MATKKTYHFISHTHWDREWYLPFERFRYRLVNLIDKLLDLLDRDPDFKYFHLDGQTIVLEDYYALRPNQKERLEQYIKAGRILIGPWYQQNDLYLTSAESTVRNLIEGIRTSRQLGGEMKVGYLPDHFGLIGQMPQIFKDIGIDNVVFGRAYDIEKHQNPFFYWQAPDGSEVTSLLMYHWYNSAQRLPSDEEQLKEMFDSLREREERINPTPHYPMMNGVDHLEAQEDLPLVLEKLRHMYGEEINIVHDTLPNFVKSVQAYMASQPEGAHPVVQGELREGFEYYILSGTLSSRVYLKQANMAAHDLIEKWVEPLSVWCQMLDLDSYETDTIQYIWKLYMENHPHDSICGCSQDEVRDQMMDRYQRLEEITGEVIDRKLSVIAKQINPDGFDLEDQKLLVVNMAQLPTEVVIQTAIYFFAEDDITSFRIEDEHGEAVPYRIIAEQPSRIQNLSPINLPGVINVKRYDIEWQPTVPALGYATYRIRPNESGQVITDEQDMQDIVLENDLLKVEVQANGMFHIINKQTGQVLRNQGQIEESGDKGDLYVYKDVSGEPSQVWTGDVEFISHVSNALYDACTYQFTWDLPASLDETKEKRSIEHVSCSFQVTLRLDRHAKQVDIQVECDNRAKDHRLRLLFPGAGQASHVLAGSQFDVVKRSWDSGQEWQRDANSQAFWKWFAPVHEQGSFAIYAKGLHDYEMINEGRVAAVTLLRGVETIHLREKVYMEQDYQPKGQCLGHHKFALAVRPFTEESATQLYQEAERYHQGVLTKLFPIDEDKWNQGRAWVQDTMHGALFKLPDPNAEKALLPQSGTLIDIDGDVMLSALKWSEDGHDPIMRLYNVEPVTSSIKLSSVMVADNVTVTNILEEKQYVEKAQAHVLETEVEAKKFKTYRL